MLLSLPHAAFDTGLAEDLAHSEYLILVLLILGPKCDMPKLTYPWTASMEAFFLDRSHSCPKYQACSPAGLLRSFLQNIFAMLRVCAARIVLSVEDIDANKQDSLSPFWACGLGGE